MDKQTIETYDHEAERIAQLHSSLTPDRLYTLITEYFTKTGNTLDSANLPVRRLPNHLAASFANVTLAQQTAN